MQVITVSEQPTEPHPEEAEAPSAEKPTVREISREQLREILDAHRKWVESKKTEGARADLKGANLQGAVLTEANLHGADLSLTRGLLRSNLGTPAEMQKLGCPQV